MPAPKRKVRQTVSIAKDAIFAKEDEEIPFEPIIVRAPGDTKGDSLERFAEIIMFGVAMIAIWSGLIGIAYSEGGEERYIILFIGGLISSAIALFMVELQAKKNDYHLMISQNYLLGLAFFFMAVGTLWGIRYLGGYFSLQEIGGLDFMGSNTGNEFTPGPNMIYAQASGAVAMWFIHRRLLDRYKGNTTFGWAVATYIPLALVLVGVGRWIEYSNNEVSYELGISIVSLCGLSMYSALMSNKSINFAVVSVVSGIIPLVYEILNENAPAGGEGGALSLLVYIVIIQGSLAGNERIKQSLAEKMSFFMIGTVVLSMFVASVAQLNLILGPFKPASLSGDAASLVTLPVALWITVLCAYFPATHKNRVPAMPIGLAFALWTLTGDGAIIPWILSLIMISYMLFMAEATRRWVADLTVSALSFSYLFSDRMGEIDGVVFGITQPEMALTVAMGIVVISETARRLEKISTWSSAQSVLLIALSSTILEGYWFAPWIFIIYLLTMVYESMLNARNGGEIERRNSTIALVTALIVSSGLLLLEKLEIPDSYQIAELNGLSLEYILLGVIVYILFNTVRDVELDVGVLLRLLENKASGSYKYDAETNAWIQKDKDENELGGQDGSFGSIGRISLAFSLLTITIGISTLDSQMVIDNYWVIGLYMIPISMLFWEINSMDVLSSQSRMIGAVMLLIIAASSLVLMFDVRNSFEGDGLFKAGIVYDTMFLAAPVAAFVLINKRGLDREHLDRTADQVMLCVLLLIGMMDQSGGLLLVSMYVLVALIAGQYRHHGVMMLAPLSLMAFLWFDDNSIAAELLGSYYDNQAAALWFTSVSGMIVSAHMLMPIAWSIREVQTKTESENPFPWFIPMIWFLLGAWALLPTASWLPLIACLFGLLMAWVRGDINIIPLLSISLIFSFILGLSDGGNDVNGDVFGISMVLSGAIVYGLWVADSKGILSMNVIDEERLSKLMPYSLDAQLRVIAISCLLLSFDVVNGLGMLAGGGWATYEAIQKGDKISILFLPLVDGLTLMNLIYQFEVGGEEIQRLLTGGVFFVEGAVMIYLSSKNDQVYDAKMFEWKDDEEFFNFIELMGFSGVVSALAGVVVAFGESQTNLALFLTAAILIALAMTGFNETQQQVRWRRALGVFGSMFTLFILYLNLDGEVIYQSLSLVMMGLLALGYGFIYMDRRSTYDVAEVAIPQVFGDVVPGGEIEPRAVTDEPEEEAVEVKSEEKELAEDESTEEESEEVDLLEDDEEVGESEDFLEMLQKEEEPQQIENVVSNVGYVKTMEGFDVRLPKESIEKITRTIEMTPHEGFKPVVRVNMLGQIVLDFEPL